MIPSPLQLFSSRTSLNFCAHPEIIVNAVASVLTGVLQLLRVFPNAIEQAEAAPREAFPESLWPELVRYMLDHRNV